MDKQAKLEAVMAAMEEELGIARRNALPLEDRKGWGTVDVEELDKTRASRHKGTAEWKQAQKDSDKLSGWKTLADMKPESDDQPEDMNAGQSHRLRMKAEIANSSYQSQRRGEHIGRASSRVSRGRGGGLAGANRSDRRAQGAFNNNTHAGSNMIMPSSKVNVKDYLHQRLNIPSAPVMNTHSQGTQSKHQTNPQLSESHSTLSSRSKSRRSKRSSHDEFQPLHVVSNAQRASLRPQTTAYSLADPETFLQSSWKPNPEFSGSKNAPAQNTISSLSQTKESLILSPAATTQNTSSKDKPAAANVGLAGSRYADQATVTTNKKVAISGVDMAGFKFADHAVNPFENKPAAPSAGLDGPRFADQANGQNSTNPFQAKSFSVVPSLVQDHSHGGPGGHVFIDTMCKFELAKKRYDDVRAILLESAVDHKRYINFTHSTEGILLRECISSDLEVLFTARSVSLKIPLQYGGNTACKVIFSSVIMASDFVTACSAVTKYADRNDDYTQNIDKLDPGEQLISLGNSEYDQTPIEHQTSSEPSYSKQMLSLMGPENMDIALEKLDELSGGDFLQTVITATEREGKEAQSADLPHDARNQAEPSKDIDYRGGLAASKYATDSTYNSIRSKNVADAPSYKPVRPGLHTAAVVSRTSPETHASEFEVDDKFRAMIKRVLKGDLSASMYANSTAQSIVGELLTGSSTFQNFNGRERESFTQGFANMMVDRAITKRTGAVECDSFSDSDAVSESKELQDVAPETTIKIQSEASFNNNALKPTTNRRFIYTQDELMAYRPNTALVKISINDERKSQADYKVPAAEITNSPKPSADYPETASNNVPHENAGNYFQKDPIAKVDVSGSVVESAPPDPVTMPVNQDNQSSITKKTTGSEKPLIDLAIEDSQPSLDLLNMASMPSINAGQEQNAGKDERVDKEQNIEKEQSFHKEQNSSLDSHALYLETEAAAESGTSSSKPVLKKGINANFNASSDTTKGLTRGLENSRWAPVSSEVKIKAAAWNGKEFRPASVSKIRAIPRPSSQLPISVLSQSADQAAILAPTAPPYSTPSTTTFTPISLSYSPAQETPPPAYEVFWVRDASGKLREFRTPLLHGGAPSPFIISQPPAIHSVAQTQPVAIGSPQPSFSEMASTVHHQANAGMQLAQSTWQTAPVQSQQASLARHDHSPFTPPPGRSDVPANGSIMKSDTVDSPFAKPGNAEDSPSITVQRELQKRLERSLAHKNSQRKISGEQVDSNQSTEPSW